MGQTHPFPETDSPDLAPFLVHSRVEIVALLRQIGERGSLTTCYFDRQSGFTVTTVLDVNPEFEEVVLDAPSDAPTLRRLLGAGDLVFVTFVDQIKMQFCASKAVATLFDGKPAFRVRLPPVLLRLQRRDFFRARTPSTRPAMCLIPYPVDEHDLDPPRTYEKLQVIDLSVGGVAVLTRPGKLALSVGQLLQDCYLDLPGTGQLTVGLRVTHVEAVPHDPQASRCGCELLQLSPQARMLLQRYINRIDAERRKVAAPT